MPGMLYHLYFGKVVLDSMGVVSDFKLADKRAFMSGNIIPDVSANKHDAHYYHQKDAASFYAPDATLVEMALASVPDASLRLGLKAHLYLDWRFSEEYLPKRFELNPLSSVVKSRSTGHIWTIPEFYSKVGLYHGYGECNGIMLRDRLISLDWVDKNVPKALPKTGIISMDQRRTWPWYDELRWMLEDPPAYTGKILVYGELVDFVQACAVDFALRDHQAKAFVAS